MISTSKKILLLGTVGVLLNACVSILPEPAAAPTIYRLGISSAGEMVSGNNPTVINIELPDATKFLSGTDIVVSPDGRRLTAASNANWAEPIPRMIRAALVDQLAGNPDIAGVIPKGSTLTPFRINMDIRRFEAVFDRGEDLAPNCIIQINLALTRTKDRALMGTRTVRVERRAGARNVSSIVETMDGISDEAMEIIETWLDEKTRQAPS